MATELIAGLGLFKTAFDIAKGLKDINDATIRNAAIIELQEMILSAQQSQSALVDRVRYLEKEMADLKALGRLRSNTNLKASLSVRSLMFRSQILRRLTKNRIGSAQIAPEKWKKQIFAN